MLRYGLIGKKLSHSFSPSYFRAKFLAENIAAQYDLFEMDEIAEIEDLLNSQHDIRGLNVTIPYKSLVIPFLDDIADEAKAVGAVNCIAVDGNRKTKGYNTDVYGFEVSAQHLLQDVMPKRAFILGTGGAAKAVEYVLSHRLSIPDITKVSRREAQDTVPYSALSQADFHHALIVQATPIGMFPHVTQSLDFPFHLLSGDSFVIDLIYNPLETKFLQACRERGAKTANGLEMLHLQAEKSWEIWKGSEK